MARAKSLGAIRAKNIAKLRAQALKRTPNSSESTNDPMRTVAGDAPEPGEVMDGRGEDLPEDALDVAQNQGALAMAPEPTHAPVRSKTIYRKAIEVAAGLEEEVFVVHNHHICGKSLFFKAAASEAWIEGQQKRVLIPTITPLVFKTYLDWVYEGKFIIEDIELPQTHDCEDDGHFAPCEEDFCQEEATILFHVKCYTAAQFLLDDAFKIAVVDALRDFLNQDDNAVRYCVQVIVNAWQNCQRGCGLQRLLTDRYAVDLLSADIQEVFSQQCPDFVTDLASRLLNMRGRELQHLHPGSVHKCFYHDHKGNEPCATIVID